MNFYHPDLHRSFPLSAIDPEYLWNHLDDPAFQRYNDVNQVRTYLEIMSVPTHSERPLSKEDLQTLAIHTMYNPYTHQFMRLDSLNNAQAQSFLQESTSRRLTLTQNHLRPLTLKAYYQEKMRPVPAIPKKPAFQNVHLCILWMEHGMIVRQIPPHCDI